MKRLSKEQILLLHSQLIHQTGGTTGVRDFNLLKSAIETPFQVFGGEELYPTIQAKGTRLGYGLIKNHCMLDGNKRIGTHLAKVQMTRLFETAKGSLSVITLEVTTTEQEIMTVSENEWPFFTMNEEEITYLTDVFGKRNIEFVCEIQPEEENDEDEEV